MPRHLARLCAVLISGVVLLLLAPLLALTTVPTAAQESAPSMWTQLAPGVPGPEPRWDLTLAADEEGGQLVVFGGRDAGGAALDDTWFFDLAEETWTQVEGPAPAPRFGQAVTVDQASRTLYLFGGEDGPTFYNDTWTLDLEARAWSQLDTGASPLPAERYGTSAVLDGQGNLIVSHGFTFEGRFDDTWSLNLETGEWTDITPDPGQTRPINRCLHQAVWDAVGERMLLFGGCASGFGPCPLGDLWAFDPATRTWTEITPANGPSARSNPAMVVDEINDRALLISGLTEAGYVADLWEMSLDDAAGVEWRSVAIDGESPLARASHDAVVVGDSLYLFGGNSANGPLADLWTFGLGV